MIVKECRHVVIGGRKPDTTGKVRDIFDLGDTLILVTTDRISAFDVILPNTIPGKGIVLNSLSQFWFQHLRSIVPNHVLTDDPAMFPDPFTEAAEELRGRSIHVRKAEVFPFECVVRGYIAGSAWKDYGDTGRVSGIELPGGLSLSEKLSEPLFTPSTKAEEGHDMPVSFDLMANDLGVDMANELRDRSHSLFEAASEHAAGRGIILADTKFEFGLIDGRVHLVDEALTPDSSRFWKADRYAPGEPQESYDKQYVREFLLGIDWKGNGPPPKLPDQVVKGTSDRYREILDILTS